MCRDDVFLQTWENLKEDGKLTLHTFKKKNQTIQEFQLEQWMTVLEKLVF